MWRQERRYWVELEAEAEVEDEGKSEVNLGEAVCAAP